MQPRIQPYLPTKTMNSLVAGLVLTIAVGAQAQEQTPIQMAAPDASVQGSPVIRCTRAKPTMPLSILRNPTFKQATATAEIELLPPGNLGQASIVQGSGYTELDSAALEAMQKITCTFSTPLPKLWRARQSFIFKVEPPATRSSAP